MSSDVVYLIQDKQELQDKLDVLQKKHTRLVQALESTIDDIKNDRRLSVEACDRDADVNYISGMEEGYSNALFHLSKLKKLAIPSVTRRKKK